MRLVREGSDVLSVQGPFHDVPQKAEESEEMTTNTVYVTREQFSQLTQLAERYNCGIISSAVYVEMAIMICPELRVGEDNNLIAVDSTISVPPWPKKSGL